MLPDPPTLDARAIVAVMGRFADALRAHREELNSLNVFPVPDGDTGTNLLLTQEAVTDALANLDGAGLTEVGDAVSRASLMGARGNSGVILSQILRGVMTSLLSEEPADARALALALGHASHEARRAVAEPKPGTVLDVIGAAGLAAQEAATESDDLQVVARAALDAGTQALEETRERNPELRRAGVVDAGGKGILLLFDALVSVLAGEDLSVEIGPLGPVGASGMGPPPVPLDFELEVMYLLDAPDHAIPGVQAGLRGVGDSVVVVGGEGLFSVHVHTNDSEAALAPGRAAGEVRDVKVTSLAEQVAEQCLATQARAVRAVEDQGGALVAVAEGSGMQELFRSLGAVVVPGGSASNPSVEELLAAIEATDADRVVVLPNHPNVLPAATRAAELAGRPVYVVGTRSMPQGIAAAAAFNPLDPVDDAEGAMLAASLESFAGAVVPAVREAETEAGPVSAGDWLGTADGRVVAIGDDPASVAVDVVGRLASFSFDPEVEDSSAEIVTLYVGAEAVPGEADRIERAIVEAFPHLELEVHDGGQPTYPYLLGVE
jgi:DAK2 domain fusion protein YloV